VCKVARRSHPIPCSRKMPSERERQLIAVRPPARAPVERVHERVTRRHLGGKARRKSKRGEGAVRRPKESHAPANSKRYATPRDGGERTCSNRDWGRKGREGDRGSARVLFERRPVGSDRRQSVTVMRCGFSENDEMTGERYG
jgi:hypothetical protein